LRTRRPGLRPLSPQGGLLNFDPLRGGGLTG
jgi:hypothetical protein